MSETEVLERAAAEFSARAERDIAFMRNLMLRSLSRPLFDAVPVVDHWRLPLVDGETAVPVLRVTPRRPEIADLARVLCAEGGGRVWSSWRWLPGHGFTADRVILDVKILRPVRAAFLLAFTAPRDRWILDAIVASERLGITGASRGDGSVAVLTLASMPNLRHALALLDGEG